MRYGKYDTENTVQKMRHRRSVIEKKWYRNTVHNIRYKKQRYRQIGFKQYGTEMRYRKYGTEDTLQKIRHRKYDTENTLTNSPAHQLTSAAYSVQLTSSLEYECTLPHFCVQKEGG